MAGFGDWISRLGLGDYEEDEEEEDGETARLREKHTGHALYLLRPADLDALERLADKLGGGAPLLVSLEGTPPEARQRVTDFCRGYSAGLRLNVEKVTDLVYLLTPPQVIVSTDEAGPGY